MTICTYYLPSQTGAHRAKCLHYVTCQLIQRHTTTADWSVFEQLEFASRVQVLGNTDSNFGGIDAGRVHAMTVFFSTVAVGTQPSRALLRRRFLVISMHARVTSGSLLRLAASGI